ncbi:hypothetical protein [Chitinophaga sp. CB10]|uniref:hypothetical protein n=1 Tax=Chitinophaga sp. CB10 TaxID=1891659 RepID=UPI0025BF0F04|nr:hypothetical protein [Chitinophaga sp. CB10]
MKFTLAMVCLFVSLWTSAQNFLPSHSFIRQKVAEGFFTQKSNASIPDDGFCITSLEAKSWLYIDETLLPSDGRMPWFSELVPLIPAHPLYPVTCNYLTTSVASTPNADFTSCGTYIYAPGFDPAYLYGSSRTLIDPSNVYWIGDPRNCSMGQYYPGYVSEGPLNRCGISYNTPNNDGSWKYITITIGASEDKIYYIGVGGTGDFRVFLDQQLVVRTDLQSAYYENYKNWHIIPVNLTAGTHTFKVGSQDYGQQQVLGFEVYDNREDEIMAASGVYMLNVLYSTKNGRGSVGWCR